MIKKFKLNKEEKAIENAVMRGEYVDIPKREFDEIAKIIASRKKDAVLNIRVNSQDLKRIKLKAQKMGIKYQTFISELIHRAA